MNPLALKGWPESVACFGFLIRRREPSGELLDILAAVRDLRSPRPHMRPVGRLPELASAMVQANQGSRRTFGHFVASSPCRSLAPFGQNDPSPKFLWLRGGKHEACVTPDT